MTIESSEQYQKALKNGRKYYKTALNKGKYPYPIALDEIINPSDISGNVEIGYIDIPAELITGTKTAGRISSFAGNFMPLLDTDTEFAQKWIRLCDAHLSDEGIRDPIKCFEYMGKFYVTEGNKRVSVLKSYGAAKIPAKITRILPVFSEDNDVKLYYEFVEFFAVSHIYDITFSHPGCYSKLLALLGFSPDHKWTQDERRSFIAGYSRFKNAYAKAGGDVKNTDLPGDEDAQGISSIYGHCAETLLAWLNVFPFSDIKELPEDELVKKITALLPDARALFETEMIQFSTEADVKPAGIISRILGITSISHLNIAFIYGFSTEHSTWTRAHDSGRLYLEERLGNKIDIKTYIAENHDYYEKMEEAAESGADIIFATTPQMIEACRMLSLKYPHIHILNCALAQPYTGVRMYYNRIHEAKFVAGAIAGAMAKDDRIGYIANYPIFGVPACINAFALGARLSNPRARIKLLWSCETRNPKDIFAKEGIKVISNRDGSAEKIYLGLEWGTYMYDDAGTIQPLATPVWNWGKFYEQVVLSVFNGTWNTFPDDKSINYWWGLNQGVIDVAFSSILPDGVCTLGWILKNGIIEGRIDPFHTAITDQTGIKRNDGSRDFTPEELMEMDWLCDNIDGYIPRFDQLMPFAAETVRLLGIYRDEIVLKKEEKQI